MSLNFLLQDITLASGEIIRIKGWGFLTQRTGVNLVAQLMASSEAIHAVFSDDAAPELVNGLPEVSDVTHGILEQIFNISFENGEADIAKITTLNDTRNLMLSIAAQNGWRDFFVAVANLQDQIVGPRVDLNMIEAMNDMSEVVQGLMAEKTMLEEQVKLQLETISELRQGMSPA